MTKMAAVALQLEGIAKNAKPPRKGKQSSSTALASGSSDSKGVGQQLTAATTAARNGTRDDDAGDEASNGFGFGFGFGVDADTQGDRSQRRQGTAIKEPLPQQETFGFGDQPQAQQPSLGRQEKSHPASVQRTLQQPQRQPQQRKSGEWDTVSSVLLSPNVAQHAPAVSQQKVQRKLQQQHHGGSTPPVVRSKVWDRLWWRLFGLEF